MLLPLTTIPPSGRNRFRSILIPANGWFSAHRRMRFMHWSPTGRSMAVSISRGRSISAVPGLRAACRPRQCVRPLSSQHWKPAWRSMMIRGSESSALQQLPEGLATRDDIVPEEERLSLPR
ncbi:hypothetical protein AMC87_CH02595 [Rhizobium phaseoli]|nr:hypothetical protein AMC87_CH02595 [Rhizobium phaseoli]